MWGFPSIGTFYSCLVLSCLILPLSCLAVVLSCRSHCLVVVLSRLVILHVFRFVPVIMLEYLIVIMYSLPFQLDIDTLSLSYFGLIMGAPYHQFLSRD